MPSRWRTCATSGSIRNNSGSRNISAEPYFPEIATSASPPRNDRGNRSPGAILRLHLSLRGPEGAVAISGQQRTENFGKTIIPRDCRVASLLAMTGETKPRCRSSTTSVIARPRRGRGNLRAATDGKFRLNDTSPRLPRRLRLLAMTESRGHTGGRPHWAAPTVSWRMPAMYSGRLAGGFC